VTEPVSYCLIVISLELALVPEGNINIAKYVMASTMNVSLFRRHWRASTAPQLAEMAHEMEMRQTTHEKEKNQKYQ